MQSIVSPHLWVIFGVFVLGVLAIDLGVFSSKSHEIRFKEAAIWSVVWISLAMIFNAWIYFEFGSQKALEFLTGYLLEEALSVDNIFVFVILLASFAVPKIYQHRVLFWGVLGAIIMRAIFIGLGAALVARFPLDHVRLRRDPDLPPSADGRGRGGAASEKNRSTSSRGGFSRGAGVPRQALLRHQDGRRYATPLLLVLVAIEATDVVFAVDSIPAIFAITTDVHRLHLEHLRHPRPRSMYFLLAGIIDKFHLLKYGLAFVLMFVGVKMIIAEWIKIPIGVSLAVIASLLATSVIASMIWPRHVGWRYHPTRLKISRRPYRKF
jgi:tellurite resistance protein TerC